jgi:hypothetical protein
VIDVRNDGEIADMAEIGHSGLGLFTHKSGASPWGKLRKIDLEQAVYDIKSGTVQIAAQCLLVQPVATQLAAAALHHRHLVVVTAPEFLVCIDVSDFKTETPVSLEQLQTFEHLLA